MVAAATQFVLDFREKKPPYWLTYLGSSGAGKTMLARRIAALTGYVQVSESATIRVASPVFCWPEIATRMRNGDWGCINPILRAEVAIIDEVAGEYLSDIVTAALCRVLNERLGKWTVITSNLSRVQLADIDARIASRLGRGGSVVVEVDVPDYDLRENSGA